MAVTESNHEQDTRDWVKVAVRPPEYARLRSWLEAVYPDPRFRPPLREAANDLLAVGLDKAEEAIKPEPTPMDRLAQLRRGQP